MNKAINRSGSVWPYSWVQLILGDSENIEREKFRIDSGYFKFPSDWDKLSDSLKQAALDAMDGSPLMIEHIENVQIIGARDKDNKFGVREDKPIMHNRCDVSGIPVKGCYGGPFDTIGIKIAKKALVQAYKGGLLHGALAAVDEANPKRVDLALIGCGVFGNELEDAVEAIKTAMIELHGMGLSNYIDVHLTAWDRYDEPANLKKVLGRIGHIEELPDENKLPTDSEDPYMVKFTSTEF